ncbi:MAG: PEP-CTERM sorting domain-containing protein [Anaerolineae bacterium]|nr:PEP-CTERM sorting domain-containing protein [Phycisphaerae bacterium]
MRRYLYTLACVVAGGLCATANAELINIDFSSTGVAGPAPASSYGAASGQAGVWNNFTTAAVTSAPLVDIGGNATAVTLSLTAGGFMFDSANFAPNGTSTAPGSNEEFLMDDVWDSPANAQITVGNLAAGAYALYVYGGSPDSGTVQMNFIVNGNSQFVGGVWVNPFDGPEDYQVGVTHALFNVNHAGGNLVINVPDVAGFESVNGLQITAVPEPASIGLIAVTALAAVRRRRR